MASAGVSLVLVATTLTWASSAWAQTAPATVTAPPAQTAASEDAEEKDPLQGFNRASFAVGMGLDKVLIGPVTHGYMAVVPEVVQERVSAAVYNLGDPGTVVNLLLQGHPKRATKAGGRFVINSTVGVLGLFDVAAKMGLQRRDADFGQTLGRYGTKAGPYLYVPVMGPMNLRDGVGRAVDIVTDPVGIAFGGTGTRFGRARLGVQLVDARARAEPAFNALKDATDPYVTLRSAYTQHRAAFVREATGEVQDLPDFDDVETSASTPPAQTSAPAGPQ